MWTRILVKLNLTYKAIGDYKICSYVSLMCRKNIKTHGYFLHLYQRLTIIKLKYFTFHWACQLNMTKLKQ